MRQSRHRRRDSRRTDRRARRWPLWLIAAGFTGFVAASLFEWSDLAAIVFGGIAFIGVLIAATRASRRSSDGDTTSTSSIGWSDSGASGGGDSGGGDGGGGDG